MANEKTEKQFLTTCLKGSFYILLFIGICSAELRSIGPELIDRPFTDVPGHVIILPAPNDPALHTGERRINHFRFYANRTGEIQLQMWRKTTTGNSVFTLRGSTTSYIVSSPGIHDVTPTTPVTIREGDLTGFYTPGRGIIPYKLIYGCTGQRLYYKYPAPSVYTVGGNVTFPENMMTSPCRNYSLQIVIGTVETPSCSRSAFPSNWVRKDKGYLVYRNDSQIMNVGTRITCAVTCHDKGWCRSFTFSSLSNICYLNVDVLNYTLSGYEKQEEADYYIPER